MCNWNGCKISGHYKMLASGEVESKYCAEHAHLLQKFLRAPGAYNNAVRKVPVLMTGLIIED